MALQSKLSTFIEELRRRRVFRVAALYGGVAFVLFQIIDSIFEPLHIPDWIGSLIIILLLVGFPLAVGLAWVFDVTPEGIVRTRKAGSRAAPGKAQDQGSGKSLTSNRALIVIAVLAVAFGVWSRWGGGNGTTGQIRSIAVLPLENLMHDPDQEYFVEAMHDLLITEISKISGLRVISRNSSAHYKGSGKRADVIAAELEVDAVVEGSVFRDGDQVRINAQLIGMRPERHLWAEVYERDLVNIFTLQREIARTIARQIGSKLGGNSGLRADQTKVVNPSSFDAYARGRQLWQKRTGPDLLAAINLFQKAISLDSTNALAWSGLADAYAIAPSYAYWPSDSSTTLARQAANRALALEPILAQPHATLGMIAADFQEGLRHFEKALSLDPNYATAYHWYGNHLQDAGKIDEALGLMIQAAMLDPHSLVFHGSLVEINYLLGDFEQYLESARRVIAEKGPHPYYSYFIADAFLLLGKIDSGLIILNELERDNFREADYALALTYAAKGDVNLASAHMQKYAGKTLLESSQKYVVYFCQLGDLDQAFERLEQFMESNDPIFALRLRHDPRAQPLIQDPRFDALIKKYGVKD